ncbi:hypothetical protein K7432_016686 [Basidiobolus ranarum]|uniref:Uncharacterized protein n=1 Tax=Basidiobolus ranarum TaxID=34480 RepID=A0ABR2WEG1_9FUNG
MLEPDTKEAIEELKAGDTRTIMITGDTALTGIYIARACGMLPSNNQVLLGDVDRNEAVVWTDIDSGEVSDVEKTLEYKHTHPVELAVTAKAFHVLCEKSTVGYRVFARMKPHDKVECVQLHMERGVTTMCGDGGNDYGALRASHVGIALSDAKASIVSSFSSSFRSIMSCVELLKQGRAALATSFAGYKHLIMYGQTMSFMKIFTFYYSMSPAQNIWILIDAFITVETLTSVLGLIIINHLFVIGAHNLLRRQPWYLCNEFDSSSVDYVKWWLLGDNYEAEVIALMALFQFVNSAFIFNLGYRFRARWYRNYALIFLWAAFVVIVSYIGLADPNRFGCLFRINCGDPDRVAELGYDRPNWYIETYNLPQGYNVMPIDFRWQLWGIGIANMVLGVLWQIVILGSVREYFKKLYPLKRLELKL